ncbi:MAG: nucleotidyltransferase domain-containing protein [Betaproteobacteria bacterium]|nr:nucleotidyltransferase domain-containing protein [Betaproteobacteria bacterium]
MPRHTELTLTAQTAYAELFEVALAADLARGVADLRGAFSSKTVKGRKYWYFQFAGLDGVHRQLYVGPDTPEVQALVGQTQTARASPLIPLARSALALGCAGLLPRHYRVIRQLADFGFFRAGGLLVGTHAFLAYGNLLGVHWGDASRTQDVDFAHAGKNLSIALPSSIEIDVPKAIESLQMGLLPVTQLSGKRGATFLNPRQPEFRLDFLTTLKRGGDEPYIHPRLGIPLQPLKFMEFGLQSPIQAALFCPEGAVTVSLPDPARYAVHKLLVYGERAGAFLHKGQKDLLQAAALLAYYRERRPWEIEAAWADLSSRGKGWAMRARRGLAALEGIAPELGAAGWLG